MLSDLITSELTMLRLYAHSILGDHKTGDDTVCELIEALTHQMEADPDYSLSRLGLYIALDRHLLPKAQAKPANLQFTGPFQKMSREERRASLLHFSGGFSIEETASILGCDSQTARALIESATAASLLPVRTGVLILEDEPHVAALLGLLVEQSGHWVAATAHTHNEAVNVAMQTEFGLIISDMKLADDSLGTQAVEEILLRKKQAIPVVYITAHPALVQESMSDEAPFLIRKPFDIWNVRNAVNRAALSALAA